MRRISRCQILGLCVFLMNLNVFLFMYLEKKMAKCKFCRSWLSKEDMIGRKINELCRVGNNNFSFCCKTCGKNFSCHKGFSTWNQHASSDEHKKQVMIYVNDIVTIVWIW